MTCGQVLTVVFLYVVALSNADQSRIPSLSEISKINDPILNEVFASSQSNIPREEEPLPQLNSQPTAPGNYQPQTPRAPSPPYTHPHGEIPIHQPDSLGASPAQPQPDSSLSQLVNTGANVFATGANALYRGAATFGQAFGLNDYPQYQIPLVSQAAQIFG